MREMQPQKLGNSNYSKTKLRLDRLFKSFEISLLYHKKQHQWEIILKYSALMYYMAH